ncbi:MAG: IclR family transcriptional regulator [Thermodesulfobacteriota bacterium]
MKTLRKGLEILNTFKTNSQSQGVTEIAKKLGFHKSSTHGLLQALKDEGYIIYDSSTRKYSLGYKPLDLVGRISYRKDLREIARPIMQELSKKCDEDVALNILVEGRSISINVIESQNYIRHIIPLGKPYPLHCRAAGKVIMAYLSEKEIDEIIKRYGLPKFTPKTITRKGKLLAELGRIKTSGYSISRQEFGPEGVSLAFPIFNRDKIIMGSLSIHSTVNRMDKETEKRFVDEGLKASERLNQILELI